MQYEDPRYLVPSAYSRVYEDPLDDEAKSKWTLCRGFTLSYATIQLEPDQEVGTTQAQAEKTSPEINIDSASLAPFHVFLVNLLVVLARLG
jgi:hypothetical protein